LERDDGIHCLTDEPVRHSGAAFEELITRFAAEAFTEVATHFEHGTYKLIETLLQHPKMGRMRTDLVPDGIRSFRVPGFDRYLLFY